jgi:hypothetical protein
MTIDTKYVDLINAEIDGEISAEDRVRLEDYLAQNPEARALREELAGLCSELDAVEFLEPPVHLKHLVLDAITRQRYSRAASDGGGWRFALSTLFAGGAMRYALAFAAGAFLSYTFVSSDQVSRQAFNDITGLVGTITEPAEPGFTAKMSNEHSIDLTLAEIAGSVSLNRAGSILILDFDLASPAPVEIVADFEDPGVWFNGFAQLESEGTTVAADSGQVTVHMAGQRRYALYLYNASQGSTTIDLRFYSGGTLIHEDTLVFDDKN